MNYITISDLKKQAKKERKNNNLIKNHAESLDAIAKKNKFDNWTSLIDNAVLIKKDNLIEDQQISLLKEFVNESITFINGLQLIFKTDSHEMLAIFINKHFLQETEKKSDNNSSWRETAKKWMECICFIFLKSDLPRNIQGFKNAFVFKNLLNIIETKNLYENENVKYLFSLTGHDKQKNLNEPDYDVLVQNGYYSMQYAACIEYIADSVLRYFNSNVAVTKHKIKDAVLRNDKLFTYACLVSDKPMLDQKRLLEQYKNSFKTDKDFKESLRIHLDLI